MIAGSLTKEREREGERPRHTDQSVATSHYVLVICGPRASCQALGIVISSLDVELIIINNIFVHP